MGSAVFNLGRSLLLASRKNFSEEGATIVKTADPMPALKWGLPKIRNGDIFLFKMAIPVYLYILICGYHLVNNQYIALIINHTFQHKSL